MNEPFSNAPDLGQAFEKNKQVNPAVREQQGVGAKPEPIQSPDELNFDPPRKVYDADREMVPTPWGTVDQDVVRGLDPSLQRSIRDSQMREPEIEDDFMDLRSTDEASRAAKEYEERIREPDNFDERMRDHFNHVREQERDLSF